MNEQEIENFSQKWIQKFSQKSYRTIPSSQEFGIECDSLGFEMDHGHSLQEFAPDLHPFTKLDDLKKVINNLNDPQILGSSLHSKWKVCNDSDSDSMSRDDRQWFLMMLNRLNDVTDYRKRHVHKYADSSRF